MTTVPSNLMTQAAAELGFEETAAEETAAWAQIVGQAIKHCGTIAPVDLGQASHRAAVIQCVGLSILQRTPTPALPIQLRYRLLSE